MPVPDDRLDSLVDAIMPLSADLALPEVLSRIVSGACELRRRTLRRLGRARTRRAVPDRLLHARHGPRGGRGRVGTAAQGRGVLGLLLRDPRPVRLST